MLDDTAYRIGRKSVSKFETITSIRDIKNIRGPW